MLTLAMFRAEDLQSQSSTSLHVWQAGRFWISRLAWLPLSRCNVVASSALSISLT